MASLNEPITECHPPKAVPIVTKIINSFRDGEKDVVTRPLWMNGHRSLIQYYALRDIDGHYLGTIEFTGSVEYILNLFENGAWDNKPDATTGASKHDDTNEAAGETVDASTGASETGNDDADNASVEKTAPVQADDSDATSAASESGSVDADDESADATTGASEN